MERPLHATGLEPTVIRLQVPHLTTELACRVLSNLSLYSIEENKFNGEQTIPFPGSLPDKFIIVEAKYKKVQVSTHHKDVNKTKVIRRLSYLCGESLQ